MDSVSDRRQFPRLPVEVEVELHQPGQPVRVARTEDLSGGGVMLILNGHGRPEIGTRVHVRVSGLLGEGETPPLVAATVVRHAEEGVAVRFVEDGQD